jgi:hypothetical protein
MGEHDGPLRGKRMERLTRNGIECAGVGIGCDVARLFDLYRVIADVRELPQAIVRGAFRSAQAATFALSLSHPSSPIFRRGLFQRNSRRLC